MPPRHPPVRAFIHPLSRMLAVVLALGLAVPAAAQGEPPRRFMMEDVSGNVVTDADLIGRFALVYFGYTGCPDVCPLSMDTVAAVMELLGPEAENLTPYFVTVDPDRDTAAVLRDYTALFDERIVGLRGPKEYTDHMVLAFNSRYEKGPADPEHPDRYSVDHTASMVFLGPDGTVIKRFAYGLSAEEVAADIRAAMAAAE